MNRFTKRMAAVSTLAVLGALAIGGSSAQAAQIPGCVKATNIEGIIDDSGSMAANDPNNYRADLMEALAFFNKDKTMGSVIFGSSASNLFGPFAVGPNYGTILGALGLVASTSGGTNYDAAFQQANLHNPNANARVFLSDGEPNFPPNSNLWKVPKIPAYVVGFGTADFTILNQIAVETGGPSPFAVVTPGQLRNVSQIINARINCEDDPLLFTRTFARSGQTRGVGFPADGNTAQVLISWETVGNQFKVSFGGGKKKGGAAAAKKKKSKVKVQTERGDSFIALNLSGIKGKVKFKINAKRLLAGETVNIAIIN